MVRFRLLSAPDRTRTCNHWIRSPVLCPIELQGQNLVRNYITASIADRSNSFVNTDAGKGLENGLRGTIQDLTQLSDGEWFVAFERKTRKTESTKAIFSVRSSPVGRSGNENMLQAINLGNFCGIGSTNQSIHHCSGFQNLLVFFAEETAEIHAPITIMIHPPIKINFEWGIYGGLYEAASV